MSSSATPCILEVCTLGINANLLAAAITKSGSAINLSAISVKVIQKDVLQWARNLSPAKATAHLADLLVAEDSRVQLRLQRQIRAAGRGAKAEHTGRRRTVGALLEEAQQIKQARKHRSKLAAKITAHCNAKKEAVKQKEHLASLAGQEDALWAKVDALLKTRLQTNNEESAQLFALLKELHAPKQSTFYQARLAALCATNERTRILIKLLTKL